MRIHGYSCTNCGFYHDRTDAAVQESGLKIKCVDCGWVETFDPSRFDLPEVSQ